MGNLTGQAKIARFKRYKDIGCPPEADCLNLSLRSLSEGGRLRKRVICGWELIR